ncbi:hypothetical protein AMC75_11665 [Staphylococcus carnosus]|uniref:hypothetical protein n=1 Tax=Staphylococcus carnosus TaxID=1281 RepID=UPI0006AB9F7D|nr:hypothetical protein [Staphylococcus carnosus]KOR12015.1 hypothetical protein AMC75_11665 [Staphylococcus carnosus]
MTNEQTDSVVINLFDNQVGTKYDTIDSNSNGSEGGNGMSDYVNKDAFEQFEKRIDNKLDSLPDRMADKMDAKISQLETRQTKWFVGIAISTAIGSFSIIIGVIGLSLNMFV